MINANEFIWLDKFSSFFPMYTDTEYGNPTLKKSERVTAIPI